MKTSITSSFLLFGDDFDPKELVKIIGIEPSSIWKVGERKIKNNSVLLHKENGWAITVSQKPCMSLENQIRGLVNRLKPRLKQILDVKKKFKLDVAFTSAVYIYGNQIPSIHLKADIVKLIADFDALIDIDIYNL